MIHSDNEKYLWFDTTNNLMLTAKRSGEPLIGTFELTARCNLACKMCYIRRPASDMGIILRERGAEEWIRLGEEAAHAGTLLLLLTGGEPLLRNDFRQIYERLRQMGFIITLYTNATLVTPELANFFARLPPNKVEITLYGASPETYQAVCGSARAFEQTLRGIELLQGAGLEIGLRSTIIRNNIDDLEALKRFADERNLSFIYVMQVFKAVRGAESKAEKERLAVTEILDIAPFGNKPHQGEECPADYYESYIKVPENTDGLFCAAGKCSYWITWDGRMLPCSLMDYPYVPVFESAFSTAWETIKESVKSITAPTACQCCEYRPFCSVCPAKLQAETGSFTGLSPYICEMAKLVQKRFRLEK